MLVGHAISPSAGSYAPDWNAGWNDGTDYMVDEHWDKVIAMADWSHKDFFPPGQISKLQERKTGQLSKGTTFTIGDLGSFGYLDAPDTWTYPMPEGLGLTTAGTTNWTFEFWHRSPTQGSGNIHKGAGQRDESGLFAFRMSRNDTSTPAPYSLAALVREDSPDQYVFTSVGRETPHWQNAWVHYSLQYDGDKFRMYTADTITGDGTMVVRGTSVSIGAAKNPPGDLYVNMPGYYQGFRLTYDLMRYTWAGGDTPDRYFGVGA